MENENLEKLEIEKQMIAEEATRINLLNKLGEFMIKIISIESGLYNSEQKKENCIVQTLKKGIYCKDCPTWKRNHKKGNISICPGYIRSEGFVSYIQVEEMIVYGNTRKCDYFGKTRIVERDLEYEKWRASKEGHNISHVEIWGDSPEKIGINIMQKKNKKWFNRKEADKNK